MNEMVNNFMRVLGDQPLSLALCAMNLLLLGYCYKITNQFSEARTDMSKMIIDWQKQTQTLMADCVSKDVMGMVLASLERDRETYRAMLPSYGQAPSPPTVPAPQEKELDHG